MACQRTSRACVRQAMQGPAFGRSAFPFRKFPPEANRDRFAHWTWRSTVVKITNSYSVSRPEKQLRSPVNLKIFQSVVSAKYAARRESSWSCLTANRNVSAPRGTTISRNEIQLRRAVARILPSRLTQKFTEIALHIRG